MQVSESPLKNIISLLRHFGEYALADQLLAQNALADRERNKVLDTLLMYYRPKQRPRTFDKHLIKVIVSLKQGYDGNKAACFYCKKICDIDNLTVHHINYVESDNKLKNLDVAQGACNTRHRSVQMWKNKQLAANPALSDQAKSEREIITAAQAPELMEWSNKEGAQHDLMRVRWNAWIHDKINGPFGTHGKYSKDGKAPYAIRVSWLAKMAPHALKTGSSVTYRRYIEEDYFGGIIDIETDDSGYKIAVYLGPSKDKSNPV